MIRTNLKHRNEDYTFKKIGLRDIEPLYRAKSEAFQFILEKYHDLDTNPACESIEKLCFQLTQPETEYYIISKNDTIIGGVRIVMIDENKHKISPIYIIPKYQGKGIGTSLMQELFLMYPNIEWVLNSIITEEKNCKFYKNLGFVPTNKQTRLQDNLITQEYIRFADINGQN